MNEPQLSEHMAILFGVMRPYALPENARRQNLCYDDDEVPRTKAKPRTAKAMAHQHAVVVKRRQKILKVLEQYQEAIACDLVEEVGTSRGTLDDDMRALREDNKVIAERRLFRGRWTVFFRVAK